MVKVPKYYQVVKSRGVGKEVRLAHGLLVLPPGPSVVLALAACAAPWTHSGAGPWQPVLPPGPTMMLALDCQCCPMSPQWVLALDCQCCPLDPQWCWSLTASAAPWILSGCWPLTASASPWTLNGAGPCCQCCPLDLQWYWTLLPVLPEDPQWCWPLLPVLPPGSTVVLAVAASAAPRTHNGAGHWLPVLPPGSSVGAGPWLPVLPPGPTMVLVTDCQCCPLDPQWCWSLTGPTIVLVTDCQCCPLDPEWVLVTDCQCCTLDPQWCWPLTASAVPWTHHDCWSLTASAVDLYGCINTGLSFVWVNRFVSACMGLARMHTHKHNSTNWAIKSQSTASGLFFFFFADTPCSVQSTHLADCYLEFSSNALSTEPPECENWRKTNQTCQAGIFVQICC